MGLGKIELIAIIALVITLIVVGGKKLPELARGIGEAGKELRKGFSKDEDEKKSDDKKTDKK